MEETGAPIPTLESSEELAGMTWFWRQHIGELPGLTGAEALAGHGAPAAANTKVAAIRRAEYLAAMREFRPLLLSGVGAVLFGAHGCAALSSQVTAPIPRGDGTELVGDGPGCQAYRQALVRCGEHIGLTFTARAEYTNCGEKSDARWQCTADALGKCAALGSTSLELMNDGMAAIDAADRACAAVR